MYLLLTALKESIFHKDWSYHGTQAVNSASGYVAQSSLNAPELFKEYFWILSLILWGVKFYNELKGIKKSKKQKKKKSEAKMENKFVDAIKNHKWKVVIAMILGAVAYYFGIEI